MPPNHCSREALPDGRPALCDPGELGDEWKRELLEGPAGPREMELPGKVWERKLLEGPEGLREPELSDGMRPVE